MNYSIVAILGFFIGVFATLAHTEPCPQCPGNPCIHTTLQVECVNGKVCQLKEWSTGCEEGDTK